MIDPKTGREVCRFCGAQWLTCDCTGEQMGNLPTLLKRDVDELYVAAGKVSDLLESGLDQICCSGVQSTLVVQCLTEIRTNLLSINLAEAEEWLPDRYTRPAKEQSAGIEPAPDSGSSLKDCR